jgi:hypothetical protein
MNNKNVYSVIGLAIQWGAIGDVGVIIDKMGGNDTAGEISSTTELYLKGCMITQ